LAPINNPRCFVRANAYSMGMSMIKIVGLIELVLMMVMCCAAQENTCFDKVHQKNQFKNADYYFDLNHDKTNKGGSFSCDLEMRASEAAKALEAFRFGVLYDSEKHVNEAVHFPLTANIRDSRNPDQKPMSIRITTAKEFIAFKKKHFSNLQTAQIACSSLHNVEIVKSRTYGFMIGGGMVWFQNLVDVPGIHVTAINLRPVGPNVVLESCSEQ
jgi:hypothetical protein